MRGFSKVGQGPSTVSIVYHGDKQAADRVRLRHGVRVMQEFERLTYFQRLMQNERTIRFDDGSWIHLQTRFGDKFATFYAPPAIAGEGGKQTFPTTVLMPVLAGRQLGNMGGITPFKVMPRIEELVQEELTAGEQEDFGWRYYQVLPNDVDETPVLGWELHLEDGKRYPTGEYYIDVKSDNSFSNPITEYPGGSGPGGCSRTEDITQSSTQALGVYRGGDDALMATIATCSTSGWAQYRYDEFGDMVDAEEHLSGTVFKDHSIDHWAVHTEDPTCYGGFYSTVTFNYVAGSLTTPLLTESSESKLFFKGSRWELASGAEWRGTMDGNYGNSALFRTPEEKDVLVFGTVSKEKADSGSLPGYFPLDTQINYTVFGGDREEYPQTGTFGVMTDDGMNSTTFDFNAAGIATVGCKDENGDTITFDRSYSVSLVNELSQYSVET